MNQRAGWPIALMILFLAGGAAAWAQDTDAKPYACDLSQARELITGGHVRPVQVPENAPELTAYPLPAEQTRPLLTDLPGRPLRQVTPAPLARAWWKYPFYLALGLPRDTVDMFFGAFSKVPILNIFFVYLPYELVPSQAFVRDPRDWHVWPGLRRNSRNHGMYDGESWGFFPSAHAWHFTYPSQRKARRNEAWNQAIQRELNERNHEIEIQNRAIATRTSEARAKALAAIQAGNGREAAQRMLAYHRAYPLDEGAFALTVTALALYAPDGPPWAAQMLWNELYNAQPRVLAPTEKLLAQTAKAHPDRPRVGQALVLTRLLMGDTKTAQAAAQAMLNEKLDDPARQRLVFETALANQDVATAQATLGSMKAPESDPLTGALMQARLRLASGESAAARQILDELYKAHPENPYINYYLGCASLMESAQKENPTESFRQARNYLERAVASAGDPALRDRARSALAYANSALAAIAAKPELFNQ